MPNNTLTLPALRTWLAPAETDLGGAIIGYVFIATAQRGFWATPFQLPQDVDVSRPISVTFIACSDFPSEVPDTFQRFQLFTSRVQPGVDPTYTNFLWSWPTPNPWNTPECAKILADNGSGVSYPGGTFTPDDTVGLWLLRNGGSPLDTSPQATRVAASLQFTYSKRCQFCCF